MLKLIFQKIGLKRVFLFTPIFFLLILLILSAFITFYYQNRIYPNVRIAGILVGSKEADSVNEILAKNITVPDSISLLHNDTSFDIPLYDLKFNYDFDQTIQNAHKINRPGNKPNVLKIISSLFNQSDVDLAYDLDESLLLKHLSVIADEIVTQPVYPTLTYLGGKIDVSVGQKGSDISVGELKETLLEKFEVGDFSNTTLDVVEIDPTLKGGQLESFQSRGELLAKKTLFFSFEDGEYIYKGSDLLSTIDPLEKYKSSEIEKIYDELRVKIERLPTNPVFVFENDRVKEFTPSTDGITILKNDLLALIEKTIWELETTSIAEKSIEIPVLKTKSEIQTEEVNNLGIRERIGVGYSSFKGSISSRIHNIGVASNSFNGILVAPGETLSFNEILGDVSSLTGYKQAYVIRDGKTVLGDGGGVCQVSTTLFRAVLNAGLPIIERRSHSYRVSYYEQNSQPGLDATVYAPTTDLKIQNDTPSHILIQTIFNPTLLTLDIEIYGTSDGRVVTLTKPIITSQSPPPEDYFQDDPALPVGTIEQIDWQAWGAKVQFDYKVTRNDEVLQEKTFYSNYRPWQAKFLRGTGLPL